MTILIRAFALAVFSIVPFVALAQHSAAAASTAYTPPLSDLMLIAQLRHIKVWLAGSAGNWALAGFELHELEEVFEHAAKIHPKLDDSTPVGQMIETIVMKPISDLAAAIDAHDRAKFVVAFDNLTAACNACHQAANRPYLVVQRPTGPGFFPNQSFTPTK
ncbi:MAG TPA: hypothetical protein VNR11_11625 [Xanthobacteraceae bacterium]|nr:hypothetical protein [Xanthobacteraceae bacterium]